MLSVFVRTLTIRVIPFAFYLTRFPVFAQMAAGMQKSRGRFPTAVKVFTTGPQKPLTYKIIQPTMQILTCTYVLVDKK